MLEHMACRGRNQEMPRAKQTGSKHEEPSVLRYGAWLQSHKGCELETGIQRRFSGAGKCVDLFFRKYYFGSQVADAFESRETGLGAATAS